MSEDTTKTEVWAIIVAIIILAIGFVIAFVIDNSIASLPGNFGPPRIIILFPIGMCAIPLIVCISLLRAQRKQRSLPKVRRYSDETMVYTGDYEMHPEPVLREGEKVYLIPKQCLSCTSPLSTEQVDWVSPLQAKCPNCGAIVQAKEETF